MIINHLGIELELEFEQDHTPKGEKFWSLKSINHEGEDITSLVNPKIEEYLHDTYSSKYQEFLDAELEDSEIDFEFEGEGEGDLE